MSASKRDELIQKALNIFYRDGFHATGMDKIVKETGISKTSMYKHFRTKDDLIIATLRLRDELFRNQIFRRVEELGKTPKDQLLALFDVLDEWINGVEFNGCMFIKASGEYPLHSSPIHATAAEHKKLFLGFMLDIATQAGAKNPNELAEQLLLLKEGAIVTAHIRGPEGVIAPARAAAALLIDAQID
ncbi:TetR family transcriptional regulator [Alphaproteobacteria bacterium 46_93_T64]|nr:TetR family transcriptional regulator [Alphaproteobacteria bacterium 46_93_T64]